MNTHAHTQTHPHIRQLELDMFQMIFTLVSGLDWHTTFLPAFKRCVDAGSASVMCSYNSINGVPACANKYLLDEVLRKRWGFSG